MIDSGEIQRSAATAERFADAAEFIAAWRHAGAAPPVRPRVIAHLKETSA